MSMSFSDAEINCCHQLDLELKSQIRIICLAIIRPDREMCADTTLRYDSGARRNIILNPLPRDREVLEFLDVLEQGRSPRDREVLDNLH